MAVEGFLFAKLPKCFLLPQLQYWLMYREGIVITSEDKSEQTTRKYYPLLRSLNVRDILCLADNTVRRSIMLWNTLDSKRPPSIQPLPLQLTKLQLRHLTFDRANEMKEKVRLYIIKIHHPRSHCTDYQFYSLVDREEERDLL